MNKILIIISYIDFPCYVGLSRRIGGIAKTLKANGIPLVIIAPIFRLKKPIYVGNINVYRVNLRFLRKLNINKNFTKLLSIFLFTISLLPYAIKYRRYIGVIQYESLFSFIPAFILKIVSKARLIGDDIIIAYNDAFYKLLLIMALKYSDYLIVSNNDILNILKKYNLKKRVLFVPNGVDAKEMPNFHIKNKRRMIFVGSLTYIDNLNAVQNIIHISKELKKYTNDFEILIVGGPLSYIKKEFLYLSSKFNIKFLGIITDKQLRELLNSSYIGLLPFFNVSHEVGGQRIKALEYFSHGLLVISSTLGVRGIKGLIPRKHYILVNSLKELIYILFDIIRNPNKYLQIAINGCIFINTNYSWDKVVCPLLKLIKNLLEF